MARDLDVLHPVDAEQPPVVAIEVVRDQVPDALHGDEGVGLDPSLRRLAVAAAVPEAHGPPIAARLGEGGDVAGRHARAAPRTTLRVVRCTASTDPRAGAGTTWCSLASARNDASTIPVPSVATAASSAVTMATDSSPSRNTGATVSPARRRYPPSVPGEASMS